MIDIETLATGPDALILTVAAQCFDPFTGKLGRDYYARVDFDSQIDRRIEQSTVAWWSDQPEASRTEAFAEDNRLPLAQVLNELKSLIWNTKFVWANGVHFDMPTLEHAYRSQHTVPPWQYYNVRDARTVYSLWPEHPRPPTTHHALEDCRRQIDILHACFTQLNIANIK